MLFLALFEKSDLLFWKRANRSFTLFLKRAKERIAVFEKSDCPALVERGNEVIEGTGREEEHIEGRGV